MEFELFIQGDASRFLSTLRAASRNRIYFFLEKLRRFPGNLSEQVVMDKQGRAIHACTFDKIEIRYWIDDADRHIKILEIISNQ